MLSLTTIAQINSDEHNITTHQRLLLACLLAAACALSQPMRHHSKVTSPRLLYHSSHKTFVPEAYSRREHADNNANPPVATLHELAFHRAAPSLLVQMKTNRAAAHKKASSMTALSENDKAEEKENNGDVVRVSDVSLKKQAKARSPKATTDASHRTDSDAAPSNVAPPLPKKHSGPAGAGRSSLIRDNRWFFHFLVAKHHAKAAAVPAHPPSTVGAGAA